MKRFAFFVRQVVLNRETGRQLAALVVSLLVLGSTAAKAQVMVGYSCDAACASYHAMLWSDGSMQDLGTLGGPGSTANGINTSGEVVGIADVSPGTSHAFLWYQGTMLDLGTLGGLQSEAQAINRDGLIVGEAQTQTGAWHAFLWDKGIMLDLGTLPGDAASYAFGINNSGQIVGESLTTESSYQAISWKKGVMQGLGSIAAYPNSQAFQVNEDGVVVGFGVDSTLSTTALLWENGVAQDIGSSIGFDSYAFSINKDGKVVGSANNSSWIPFGFLWHNGIVKNLSSAPGIGPNVTGTFALWIDNADEIVGDDSQADGNSDATLWKGGVFQDVGTLGGPIGEGNAVVHAIEPVTAPPATIPEQLQPTQISAMQSTLTLTPDGDAQIGTITLTNISTSAIAGPLQLIFATLPSDVTLAKETGDFLGIPYLTASQPDGLAAGQSITIPIKFKDPSQTSVSYNLELYSGTIQ